MPWPIPRYFPVKITVLKPPTRSTTRQSRGRSMMSWTTWMKENITGSTCQQATGYSWRCLPRRARPKADSYRRSPC
ncbi:MAG TPA: hypothetical protein G4O15_00040 [Dehalococcoidia bacterium]|nr:hypothetical protein [Dehalococcoidia bacterium]